MFFRHVSLFIHVSQRFQLTQRKGKSHVATTQRMSPVWICAQYNFISSLSLAGNIHDGGRRKSVSINSPGINQNDCCYLKERVHSVSQLKLFDHCFILAEENSKGKKRKWEPVVLDDPSFFAGEMDGFVSLEVMEDYDLKELTGIGTSGPARKKKIKERSLQKVNCLKCFKTYRMVKFRR